MSKSPLTFDESKLKDLCSDILYCKKYGVYPENSPFVDEVHSIKNQLNDTIVTWHAANILESMVASRAMEFVVNGC